MKAKKPKPKKCKVCGNEYYPYSSLSVACSPSCAVGYVQSTREKAAKKREREERKAFQRETRERKDKLKSRSDHLRDCQRVFNKYIRLRDKGKACISCGKMPNFNSYIGGSGVHAGHYKTTAAAPELRFHEDNCHVQCYKCNVHLSGNIDNYRPNLKVKIGDARLEFIEGPHQAQNWSIEDLKEIKQYYKDKIKELENDD